MTIEDLYLTKEQKAAVAKLNAAIRACVKAKVTFSNRFANVLAFNGKYFTEDECRGSRHYTVFIPDVEDEFAMSVTNNYQLFHESADDTADMYIAVSSPDVLDIIKEAGL